MQIENYNNNKENILNVISQYENYYDGIISELRK